MANLPLSAAFLGDAEAAPALADDAARLETVLQTFVARARAPWPDFGITAESFVSYIGRKLRDRGDFSADSLKALEAKDLWLAYACLENDTRAQRELAEVVRDVGEAVGRAERVSSDGCKDIIQGILEMLLVGRDDAKGRLETYSGKGRIRSWLWTRVGRETIRYKQKRARADAAFEEGLQGVLCIDCRDPELQNINQECAALFRASFRVAVSRLDDEQRLLLRYWLHDGLTLEEIGNIMHVHRATVVRWARSIRKSLLKNTRLEMAKSKGLNQNEIDSLLMGLQSRFEASLSGAAHHDH